MNIITVIGNGFDLQLGLKTRYTDFFEWLFEDKDKSTKDNYIDIIPDVNNKSTTLKEMQHIDAGIGSYNTFSLPDSYTFHCDISRISDWWSLYFLEKKDKLPDSNWCSVEEEIEKVFHCNKNIDAFNEIVKLGGMVDWSKEPPMKSVDFYGAIRMRNKLYPDKNENIFDYLLKELNKFENKFVEYLKTILPKDYPERFVKLRDAIDKVAENDYQKVVDSKYAVKKAAAKTEPLKKKIEKEYLKFGETFHVHTLLNFNYLKVAHSLNLHGNITDNNIVFGINETAKVAKGAEIFKKTYRKLFLTGTQGTLPETCEYLLFFGHSLAHADYSYFQSLFDRYDIYGGETKLIFFLNNKLILKNPKYVPESTNAIYNLIHEYGEGTLNGRRGNNLLHKLLLENRIQIIKSDFPTFDEQKTNGNMESKSFIFENKAKESEPNS
jgi:hypothetical protein